MGINPEFFLCHLIHPEELDRALDALDAWIYRYIKSSTQAMMIFNTEGCTSTRMFKHGKHGSITKLDKFKIVDAALDCLSSVPEKAKAEPN